MCEEQDPCASVLDLLDLDESLVDEKIDILLKKPDLSIRQLNILIALIKYKREISIAEETSCDSEYITNFALRNLLLVQDVLEENFKPFLKILTLSVELNQDQLEINLDHILQQLLSAVTLDQKILTEDDINKNMVLLTIINDLATTSFRNRIKLNLKFMRSQINTLLQCKEKKINVYIFSNVIPNLIKSSEDYDILNYIYDKVVFNIEINQSDILILCTLTDFFFPSSNGDLKTKLRSSIAQNIEFWEFLRLGFMSDDEVVKKCVSYLAKRTVDHVLNNEVHIKACHKDDDFPLFYYDKKEKDSFKNVWSNFFIIMEGIQEKQFNLVEPALDLLGNIEIMHPSWTYCLLKNALQHENNLVLLKTLNIALKIKNPTKYSLFFPYKQMLLAMNKIFIYDGLFDSSKNNLMQLFHDFISCYDNFCNIISNITRETFSPIPRFFMCYMLMNSTNNKYIEKDHLAILKAFLFDGVGYVSNNVFIENGTQVCLLNFYFKNLENYMSMDFLIQIILKFDQKSLYRNSKEWKELVSLLKKQPNKQEFLHFMTNMMCNCDSTPTIPIQKFSKLLILMADASILDLKIYIDFLNSKLEALKDSEKRAYAAIDEFDDVFVLITETLKNLGSNENPAKNTDSLYKNVVELITNKCDIISYFLISRINLLSSEDCEIIDLYVKGFEIFLSYVSINILIFSKVHSNITTYYNAYLQNRQFNLFVVKLLSKMSLFLFNYEHFSNHEKLTYYQSYFNLFPNIYLGTPIEFKNIGFCKGNVASSLLDSVCEINFYYLKIFNWSNIDVITVNKNLLELLEKGGSLQWTINVSNTLLPHLIVHSCSNEIEFLLHRIWTEIMQIRKNEQFRKCIDGFIKILFNKTIFESSKVQELCLNYGRKIIELGELNPNAIFLLVHHINGNMKESNLKPLSSLLTAIALNGAVLRRDQRIELDIQEYIEANILTTRHPDLAEFVVNPTNKVKLALLEILLSQNDDLHSSLIANLKEKINLCCKSKHHYHTNSLNHRILFRALQNILLLFRLTSFNVELESNIFWAMQMLCKHPHHISVKILYEWIIALLLIRTDFPLVEAVEKFKLTQVPQVSYFTILYHVLKRQILVSQKDLTVVWKNFDFVMNTLLSNTMGQLFNLRLHAQYLANKLYSLVDNSEIKHKYGLFNEIIKNNLLAYADKIQLKNIQTDFYINNFDIIDHLNIEVLFYHIPCLTGVSKDEWLSIDDVKLLDATFISSNIDICNHLLREMSSTKESTKLINEWELAKEKNFQGLSGSIQKKFIPWKNMLLDLGIHGEELSKREESNQLIIVASLIDRLPNLGGLSRTCEVFGVKTYVISSLGHLQDRQFQNLSVSSENWVDIKEVQPGTELKKYLMDMKQQGYKIIGVEQTTRSIPLNEFKFPKNTLLLLGHEKDGIPADLLYITDQCVEVPQKGLVRSLNVHVTASIFIWEYSLQHTL